jgi:hypothetical protein
VKYRQITCLAVALWEVGIVAAVSGIVACFA